MNPEGQSGPFIKIRTSPTSKTQETCLCNFFVLLIFFKQPLNSKHLANRDYIFLFGDHAEIASVKLKEVSN